MGQRSRLETWLHAHLEGVVFAVVTAGFLVRATVASRTFLYPDEALHYLLANQPSAVLAYKASLTNAHPPLLFLVLHFWRLVGNSEFVLRLPGVVAGTVFPWVAFKWLRGSVGEPAGLIGLMLLTFSPTLISLSAQLRGYALLLLFIASALYFLDRALAEQSIRALLLSFAFLYLAILTEYSAIWFALAAAGYALVRMRGARVSARMLALWLGLQVGTVALCAWLYATHISTLRGGALEREAIEGWLHGSYFQPGHDNLLVFPVRATIDVFGYVFGQRYLGFVMLPLFVVGVAGLVRRRPPRGQSKVNDWALGILLLLPFVIVCGAAVAGLYPYGGSRHTVFLAPFATAGAGLALARWPVPKTWPALLAAAIAATVYEAVLLPTKHTRSSMRQAVEYLHQSVSPGGLLFVDYMTSVELGYYVAKDETHRFDEPQGDLLEYRYGGYRVVSTRLWTFSAATFATEFDRLLRVYRLSPGDPIWVVRAGDAANLMDELVRRLPEFTFLGYQSFGPHVSLVQVRLRERRVPAAPAAPAVRALQARF